MKVTILGCGGSAGVPMIGGSDGEGSGIWGACDPNVPRNYRTRSSIVLEDDSGFRLLVDSGPDIRQQMLSSGMSYVNGVIYTHAHSDHIAGLDELRAVNRVIQKPLFLLGTRPVLDELHSRFSYAFRPWDGKGFFRPVFDVFEIVSGQDFHVGSFHGKSFSQQHGRMESLGMRFGDFAYSTDVSVLSENALKSLEGIKVWVVGCFQHAPHSSHAWVDRVLEWRERLKPERVILTHMGPDMDYPTLCAMLPEGVIPAWDGMIIEC